ncbi:hypothetical protein E4T44_09828 [Aureobasidium sp. EXF-8845]|nr:hypothetical protein E4T44_09828 [Aureobasidium sp. EXF-8845]
MHYLKPPLLHRDLKVENVLITNTPKGAIYKLCDFGSTAAPRPAATNAHEGRIIEEDIQRHTTMQYRSPEMVDVWRRQPIDEKSDIWALGVLLYKLCYYTTPFEEVGQMAILNASFKYPHYPAFSSRLKALIGSCLREDPRLRPNIYQVITEVCSMRGTPVPIKDIYAQRTQSEAGRNQKLPDITSPVVSPSVAGISHASPVKQKQYISDIAPMRRGRPTAAAQPQVPTVSSAKNSDPFSALDSASNTIRSRAVDELSAKFPSLDEFSIAHESGGFNFSSSKPKKVDSVTSALADDLFARPASANATLPPRMESAPAQASSKPITKSETSVRAGVPPKPKTLLHQPAPQRPGYSSAGTMTPPSEAQPTQPIMPKLPDVSKRPIWRVPEPDHSRASSQPRASPLAQIEADRLQPSAPPAQRPALLDSHRSKSQTATMTMAKQTTSSRPSLEGHRPSFGYEDGFSRTRSANSRPRPVSAAYVDSNLDYLREQEAERKRPSLEIRRSSRSFRGNEANLDDANIDSDADYLRSLEGNGGLSRRSSGKSISHNKRSSMSALSFSGTKNMLTGRFNDAFKRFEQTGGDVKTNKSGRGSESGFRTPSPNPQMQTESNLLSPISGSDTNETPRRPEVVNPNLGDLTETEDLPPEMRREMERLQLAQEEKRVAAAKAEHRTRGGAPPVPSKANMIQQRVQSLLDDGQKSPVRKRQAEGYGRYTERTEDAQPERQSTPTAQPTPKKQVPPIARKPATPVPAAVTGSGDVDMNLRYHKVRQSQSFPIPAGTYPLEHSVSAPAPRSGAVPRPSAPAKPAALKTGGSANSQGRPQSSGMASPVYSQPSRAARGPSLAALMARDNEGVAGVGAGNNSSMDQGMRQESDFANQADFDDWQADFSKRYPSLSGIEMVEREIAGTGGSRDGGRRGMRVRDV